MKVGIWKASAIVASFLSAGLAYASPATVTSPTGGQLPAGVTQIGGIVLDLKGANGNRIVSQLAASSLYQGYADTADNGPPTGSASGNPLLIGTQTGFGLALIAALGGGISSAAIRFTLYDGDSGPLNFDSGTDNTLLVNGVDFGYWSGVNTTQTSSDGLGVLSTGTGFGDDILSTGFFSSTDPSKLASLFSSLASGSVAFSLLDADPYDNYFDFSQGVDGGLINVGTGPVVTPPISSVPETATWAMMLIGFGTLGSALRLKRRVPSRAIA